MAKFLEKFRKRGEEGGDANQVISSFNEERSKKRIEIENTPHFFFSAPTLRSGAVIIFTPERFKQAVSEGKWVRIRMPGADRMDLRMQITSARHGGTGEMSTTPDFFSLLCKIPGASLESSKRGADRYTTLQFKDLLLDLTSPAAGSHPVIDLSAHGLKIHVADPAQIQRFTIGEYLSRGKLRLGSKAQVELLDLIPRAHFEDAVGLEMNVNPNGHSRRILDMFLDSLQSKAKQAANAGDSQ